MSDVTNDLIYELLTRVHAKLAEHDRKFDEITLRLGAIESHMAGFQLSEIRQNSELDALRNRVERIEKRLELVD